MTASAPSAAGWDFAGSPAEVRAAGGPVTTLVQGSSFCLSSATGNVLPHSPMGLFVRDARFLSTWVLEADGAPLEPLTVAHTSPFQATFVARVRPRPGHASSTLLVVRERTVTDGMDEVLRVRNLSAQPARLELVLRVDADFADLFEVKESRVQPHHGITRQARSDGLEVRQERGGRSRACRVRVDPPARVDADGRIVLDVEVGGRGEWSVPLAVDVTVADQLLTHRPGASRRRAEAEAVERLRRWSEAAPTLVTPDEQLVRTLTHSVRDLGALQIVDPAHPDRVAVAAGAPWFMALFGRDSIIASLLGLPLTHELALGTLNALAALQGTRVDPATEEQPGRILHEVRFSGEAEAAPVRGGGRVYYGSVDATPLFVVLLGELLDWGVPVEALADLVPAADRALDWVEHYGDRDGDGFVEYQQATPAGLVNQGWKDSFDAITFASGELAEPPIALVEVQGYVHAAWVARARLARALGDQARAADCEGRAGRLRDAFDDAFWLPDRGWYALGLDGRKRPIDSLASNQGHALWSGIVPPDRAAAVAEQLLGEDMFTGWGVRTLAGSMAAYNPLSYHNGSVWPHDNALLALGLRRYGLRTEARRVAMGLLRAATHFDGRLPELFCGFSREELREPVPYPTSCSPQAWAAASPVALLRAMAGLAPAAGGAPPTVDPALPPELLPMQLSGLRSPTGVWRVEADRDGTGRVEAE